jgi:hypothetical protein
MRVVIVIVVILVVVLVAMGVIPMVKCAMCDRMGVRVSSEVFLNCQVRWHQEHLQRVGAQSHQQKQSVLFLGLSI